MSKTYFAAFRRQPSIITEPGDYLTRAGARVTITEVNPRLDFGCEGTYASGRDEAWHRTGRLFAARECDNDIVCRAPSRQPTITERIVDLRSQIAALRVHRACSCTDDACGTCQRLARHQQALIELEPA